MLNRSCIVTNLS